MVLTMYPEFAQRLNVGILLKIYPHFLRYTFHYYGKSFMVYGLSVEGSLAL